MADETENKTAPKLSSFLPLPEASPEEHEAAAAPNPLNPNADDDSLDEDDSYHSRIVIKANGEVVIENLSMDLMELVEQLDPDAQIACDLPDVFATPETAPEKSK